MKFISEVEVEGLSLGMAILLPGDRLGTSRGRSR